MTDFVTTLIAERLEDAKEWRSSMNRQRLEMLIDETFFYQITDRRRKPWPTIRKLRRELM